MEQAAAQIELPDQPLDCATSSANGLLLIAAALVTGQVVVHSAQRSGSAATSTSGRGWHCQSAWSRAPKKSTAPSARAVCFSPDASSLLYGTADGALVLVDVATGQLQRRLRSAHSAAVSRAIGVGEGDALFAVGDEEGRLAVWDTRCESPAMDVKRHTDFISDLALRSAGDAGAGELLVASGDGSLSAHDLRSLRCIVQTEDDADDELLSVASVKGGAKVVAGTQSGVLNIYTWGAMADCSDRFPGHPASVDALIKWDEDALITGSRLVAAVAAARSDGLVRAIHIHPNKLLGVVGVHEEDMPVERLAGDAALQVLISSGHEPLLKLWDLGEQAAEAEEQQDSLQRKRSGTRGEKAAPANGASSDGDDSDKEEEGSAAVPGVKRPRRSKREKTRMTAARGAAAATRHSNFFSDLL